ncbi:MAG TPA: glutathione peroxidase [Chitinophagaceae bacterium]|nr:glutathione peroxidase [Chitinophagaceae bacterium]
MTPCQTILKLFYPLWMMFSKLTGIRAKYFSNNTAKPAASFYNLHAVLNNGERLDFASLRNKKVLIVNTASDCGYTPQYAQLQQLHKQFENKLAVLGFPANDFKHQEKGSDEAIAKFCTTNFGVEFPLMKKSVVKKNEAQNEVFQWLTDKNKNGWNNKQPSWNFSKYLIDEEGRLTHYFDPSVSPVSKEVVDAINC